MKSSLLLISLLVVVSPSLSNAAEDCNAGEELLDFFMHLDEDSVSENGWYLRCEGEGLIWDVPVGTMQTTDPNGPGYYMPPATSNENGMVHAQVCLPEDFTCNFTLVDSWGDGLLYPGYYSLTFGATTIAVTTADTAFSEQTHCFGPHCNPDATASLPIELVEECDNIYANIRTDLNAEQLSFNVTCDGTTVLHKSDFSTPFEEYIGEKCVSVGACCIATVTDTGNDGLIVGDASGEEELGFVYLEWASEKVLWYTGQEGLKFGTLRVAFGTNCPTEEEIPSDNGSSPTEPNVEDTEGEGIESDDYFGTEVPEAANGSKATVDETQGLSIGPLVALIATSGFLAIVGIVYIVHRGQQQQQQQQQMEIQELQRQKQVDESNSYDLKSVVSKETTEMEDI